MSEHEDNNDQQDHHHHHEPDPDEPRRWLDSPANVKKVIRWFFISCVVVALLDAVFWFHIAGEHKHTSFGDEGPKFEAKIPFFHCLYGLAACVILVILAKGMRKLLMRDEDYYDR